jgi:type III secretion protein J
MDARRRSTLLLLLLAVLLLCGCRQDLYNGLEENEANRMLSALLENGIAAEKALKGKNGVTLSVPGDEVVRALKILRNQSLPRERFKNMGEVFSGQGMIASPTEEQARMAFAIAQELAATFARIDGVLTARAHVVLETRDAASGTRTPASAAIFLRYTPESPAVSLQGKIKETCVQSVPGLAYERVSVMLAPAREEIVLPPASTETPPASPGSVLAMLAAMLALAAGAFFLGRRGRQKGKIEET